MIDFAVLVIYYVAIQQEWGWRSRLELAWAMFAAFDAFRLVKTLWGATKGRVEALNDIANTARGALSKRPGSALYSVRPSPGACSLADGAERRSVRHMAYNFAIAHQIAATVASAILILIVAIPVMMDHQRHHQPVRLSCT